MSIVLGMLWVIITVVNITILLRFLRFFDFIFDAVFFIFQNHIPAALFRLVSDVFRQDFLDC